MIPLKKNNMVYRIGLNQDHLMIKVGGRNEANDTINQILNNQSKVELMTREIRYFKNVMSNPGTKKQTIKNLISIMETAYYE